jgi:hypothetical protein
VLQTFLHLLLQLMWVPWHCVRFQNFSTAARSACESYVTHICVYKQQNQTRGNREAPPALQAVAFVKYRAACSLPVYERVVTSKTNKQAALRQAGGQTRQGYVMLCKLAYSNSAAQRLACTPANVLNKSNDSPFVLFLPEQLVTLCGCCLQA